MMKKCHFFTVICTYFVTEGNNHSWALIVREWDKWITSNRVDNVLVAKSVRYRAGSDVASEEELSRAE